MRISKEVKVGILAIVSGVILYYGFYYLKGIDFRASTNRYFLYFDHVNELQVSNPVFIEGVSVGRVGDIQLNQKKDNIIIVAIDIDSDIKLSHGTTAILYSTGIMGGNAIKLKLNGNKPPY